MQALTEKYKKLSPHKTKARRDLTRAVFEGKIIKPSNCEKCDKPVKKEQLHGHHYDYNRSFDVLWLCSPCHQRLHWTKVGDVL